MVINGKVKELGVGNMSSSLGRFHGPAWRIVGLVEKLIKAQMGLSLDVGIGELRRN